MTGTMPVGPYSRLVRLPALLECVLEGGAVASAGLTQYARPERIAASCEGLSPAEAAVRVSRSCARSAVHHAAAFCEAVEGAQGIEVPEGHGALRVALSEATRAASHLEVVSDIGQALEDDILFGRPRRHIARIRAAVSGLCGNPFGFGAVVPGGVRVGGGPEALAGLVESCRGAARAGRFLSARLKMSRARLSSCALEEGDLPVGHPPAPAFRGSGSALDLRAGEDPVGYYAVLGYRPVSRSGGTPLDRVAVLLEEVAASGRLVEKVERRALDPGDLPRVPEVGRGSGSGGWESPHGALEYRVLMGAGGKVLRVRSFGASHEVGKLAGAALAGVPFDDCAVALISFNLCGCCEGARG